MDEKLEAWRQGSDRSTYKKGEYVRHNGRKFVCSENHYSTSVVEPGKGEFWPEYWDLIEEVATTSARDVSISTEEVSFPPVDVSKRLSFESPEVKSEWPWKGAWNDDIGFEYKADDCVDHDGVSYRCLYDHFSSPNLEPGMSTKWHMVWQRLGRTKPEAEPKAKLYFAVDGPSSIEEVDLERLQELFESGDCKINFEVREPCKPIKVMDLELIEIVETDEGTYVHFLILRDLTDD